jgi:DNA-directed RNA polymerase subunit RPC12/RpoP
MQVHVFNDPDKIFDYDVDVKELTKKDRTLRAAKGSGMFLGMAVVVAPIPVLHLFLIPLSLMLSIFTGARRMLQKIEIKDSEVLCPQCKTQHKLNMFFTEWPLRVHCPNCRTQFLVKP